MNFILLSDHMQSLFWSLYYQRFSFSFSLMIWLSGKAHISITWALSNNLSLSASKAVEWDYHKSAFFFTRSLWKHRLFHSKFDFNNRDVHCIHISCCSHQWRGLSSKTTVSKPVNNCWQNIKLHFEETNSGWHYKRKEWKCGKKRLLLQVIIFHFFIVTQDNVQLYVLSV